MGTDPEAPRRPEPPPDPGADPPFGDADTSQPESPPSVGTGPEVRRRPEPPHYPPPSSANWPGWMPPGTSVPPGLPGPPSRYPTKRRRSPAGCLLTVALFIVVAAALIWVVTHRQ